MGVARGSSKVSGVSPVASLVGWACEISLVLALSCFVGPWTYICFSELHNGPNWRIPQGIQIQPFLDCKWKDSALFKSISSDSHGGHGGHFLVVVFVFIFYFLSFWKKLQLQNVLMLFAARTITFLCQRFKAVVCPLEKLMSASLEESPLASQPPINGIVHAMGVVGFHLHAKSVVTGTMFQPALAPS